MAALARGRTLAAVASDVLQRQRTGPKLTQTGWFVVYVDEEWRDFDKFNRIVADHTMGYIKAFFPKDADDEVNATGQIVLMRATMRLTKLNLEVPLTLFHLPLNAAIYKMTLTDAFLQPSSTERRGQLHLPGPAFTKVGCIIVHSAGGVPRVVAVANVASSWWLKHGWSDAATLRATFEEAERDGALSEILQTWRWGELEPLSNRQPIRQTRGADGIYDGLSDELRAYLAEAAAAEVRRRQDIYRTNAPGNNQPGPLEVLDNVRWDVFKGGCDVTVKLNSLPGTFRLNAEEEKLLRAWCSVIKAADAEGGRGLANALKALRPDDVRGIKVRDATEMTEGMYFVVSADALTVRQHFQADALHMKWMHTISVPTEARRRRVVPWPEFFEGKIDAPQMLQHMREHIDGCADLPVVVYPNALSDRDFDAVASIRLDAIETVASALLTTLCGDEPATPQGQQEPGDLEWATFHQPAGLQYLEVRGQRQFMDALRLAARDLLEHWN